MVVVVVMRIGILMAVPDLMVMLVPLCVPLCLPDDICLVMPMAVRVLVLVLALVLVLVRVRVLVVLVFVRRDPIALMVVVPDLLVQPHVQARPDLEPEHPQKARERGSDPLQRSRLRCRRCSHPRGRGEGLRPPRTYGTKRRPRLTSRAAARRVSWRTFPIRLPQTLRKPVIVVGENPGHRIAISESTP